MGSKGQSSEPPSWVCPGGPGWARTMVGVAARAIRAVVFMILEFSKIVGKEWELWRQFGADLADGVS